MDSEIEKFYTDMIEKHFKSEDFKENRRKILNDLTDFGCVYVDEKGQHIPYHVHKLGGEREICKAQTPHLK